MNGLQECRYFPQESQYLLSAIAVVGILLNFAIAFNRFLSDTLSGQGSWSLLRLRTPEGSAR